MKVSSWNFWVHTETLEYSTSITILRIQ